MRCSSGFQRTALTAMLAGGLTVAGSSTAWSSCGDRPGTPNETEIYPVSGNQLDFRWRNTTNKGMNPSGSIGRGDQPHRMYFDIYVRTPQGGDTGHDVTGGARQDGLVYGMRSRITIGGLVPNTQYCVSLRARTEGNREGCVSQLASAPVCGTTLGPGQSRAAPPFDAYRASASAPPQQPPPPVVQAPNTANCTVMATVRVPQCRNLTGEPSQYFSPLTLTGCGKDRDTALQSAAASAGLCLGDQPGCCSYNADYATRSGAAVSPQARPNLTHPNIAHPTIQPRPDSRPHLNENGPPSGRPALMPQQP